MILDNLAHLTFEANFDKLGPENLSLWAYLTIWVPCKDSNGSPQHGQPQNFWSNFGE